MFLFAMKVIPSNFFEGYELTDPICMVNLLNFMKEEQDEDEEIIQKIIDQESLMIVTWHQPWYHTEGTLTVPPPKRNGEDMYRTDKFSEEESKRINKNWKKFRKMFDIPDKPRCLARIKRRSTFKAIKKLRLYLTQFLARGLERCMEQVYHYFVRHYAYENAKTYTDIEHQVIKVCLIHSPEEASTIASYVLAREPRCVYRKINEIRDNIGDKPPDVVTFPFKKKLNYSKRKKWTLELATTLLKSILKHSNMKLEQIKNQEFTTEIWKAVEKEMGTESKHLKEFWYSKLHVQLFTEKKLKKRSIVKKVFKICQMLGYRRWKYINWKHLASRYFPDGVTGLFLYRICFRCVESFNESLSTLDLNEKFSEILERNALKRHYIIRQLKVNEQGEIVLRYQNDQNGTQ